MPQFEIADLVLDVESDKWEPMERMMEFRIEQHRPGDLDIRFRYEEFIAVPDGDVISEENQYFKWLRKPSGDKGYYIYSREAASGSILVLADIDPEWRKVIITCRDFTNKSPDESFSQQTWVFAHVMMGVIYRYNILYRNGIVIHSSALKLKDRAIIFSAPSGTGKSTHAQLWQRHVDNVKILNDDTPAVQIIGGKPFVFGTPWSGSSLIHCNDSAPLEAIVILEQAEENRIRKITGQEAILGVMPRVFLPYFDQTMMIKAMGIFERIISTVPVYLLQCRPDKEAVEMVYQCLK
ncbi:hypothetical protein SAMN05443529_12428 [Desulfosporosinus hippei DSM 8344]|uniref:SynChlorMet cassette protein ScmC n=1 Tax=Desulfosporosinus hippei DSM 8344 TaxID=1121419 RepID=A0A1G8H2J9_9FIRM|nr:hypothetical protein [Desulfosporosinus hippei]SDI00789.1 hypothetical protein SAMN05443529_12428 [Desulfosporosinus hippei DSM 8344]